MVDLIFIIIGVYIVFRATKSFNVPKPGFIFVLTYAVYVYFSMVVYRLFLPMDVVAQNLIRISFLVILFANLFVSAVVPYRANLIIIPDSLCFRKAFGLVLDVTLGITVSLVIIYLISLPKIPIFQMFNVTEFAEFAEIREAATVDLPGSSLYFAFFYDFFPIIWAGYYLLGRKKKFKLAILLNIFITLATGQKAPLIYILGQYAFLRALAIGQLNFARSLVMAVLVFVIILAIVFLQNFGMASIGLENTGLALAGLGRRIFYASPSIIEAYTQIFPKIHPYDYTNLPPDQIAFRHLFPGVEVKGTANAVFIANLYAKFGYSFGLLFLLVFFVSVIIFSADSAFTNVRLTSAWLVFYSMMMVSFVKLNLTDIKTALRGASLSCFSILGLTFIVEAFIIRPEFGFDCGSVSSRSRALVIVSICILLYFFQGQLRTHLF